MLTYFMEYNRYMNIIGIAVLIMLAYLFSNNRSKVDRKLVINGLLLQAALAVFVLKTSIGFTIFNSISAGIRNLYNFAEVGINFVFGSLANPAGPWGVVFAIRVLPIIVFFGAFTSLLFYCGIIQRVVACFTYVIRPVLGTSGAETLCAVANSFLGQTEAPLLIKHYLKDMTRSEMMVVMTSGFATVSGSLLAVYASMGVPSLHMLAASVMAIPGSIVMAKIFYPETQPAPKAPAGTQAHEKIEAQVVSSSANFLDAISSGTTDGMYLALNVGAMLISFLGLIALVNALLGSVSTLGNYVLPMVGCSYALPALDLNFILSYVFAPISYLMGFVGQEALSVANLLGIKITANEFIAFHEMVSMPLSIRTQAMLTYALCSFANFSCIGIQIGGIGVLVPEKRLWLSELGLRAVFAATLANIMSALIAGLLI
ncbi:MAG: nucleoside transporter C-terminal domain-containing protein [Candidatus Chromulinivorax sp.]|nr:nucleoside transporter C-terminal domain-containing protein [Candidatus Chromulinivorax sp.]